MKKLLIIGINTRGIVNSASKLDYCTYSVSYFSTADFKAPFKEKHVLEQFPGKSCGIFENNYNPKELLDLSSEYLEEIDYIVLSPGISPNDFKGNYKKYKKKIIGNQDTNEVENKYKFYKKIKNKFLTPKTYKLKFDDFLNIDENKNNKKSSKKNRNTGNTNNSNYKRYDSSDGELVEIAKQHEDISFIIKPLQGSGGYGISYLNYSKEHGFKGSYTEENIEQNIIQDIYKNSKNNNSKKGEFLVQEFINGTNISSSLISTKNDVKSIINSKILIESDFGLKNDFKYSGNIMPLNCAENINISNKNINKNKNKNKKIIYNYNNFDNGSINDNINDNEDNNRKISEVSEKLISEFNLKGSNGVDMVLKNGCEDQIYAIEINPRFQGTYECVENVLGINLLEAHINACNGKIINIPESEGCCIKRVIYSNKRIKAENLINTDFSNTNEEFVNFKNCIYDIPHNGVIIEKNQPLATIIAHENNFTIAKSKIKLAIQNINKNIRVHENN